jgi:hypothetical protein
MKLASKRNYAKGSFYYVYCVPCTANRKPVCHFTCGLLTFTEARRDRTTAHRLRPACRPDAESLGAAQCRCRLPCPVPSPPLNACRCAAGGRVLSMPRAQCVRRPGGGEGACVCHAAVCRIRPLQPETAPGMYARRTICKQSANNRRRSPPLKQYPETVQKLGKCPPSKASEDALRRTKCAN